MDRLLNILKEFKNLNKQVIWDIYIGTNWTKLAHDAACSDSKVLLTLLDIVTMMEIKEH